MVLTGKFFDALRALAKPLCEDYKTCLPSETHLVLEIMFAKEKVKEMVCGLPAPGQDIAAKCREYMCEDYLEGLHFNDAKVREGGEECLLYMFTCRSLLFTLDFTSEAKH